LVDGGKRCPLCNAPYGNVNIGGKSYSKVVLSARMLLEPVILFEKPAGDNRVYSDVTIPPLIWISRADNAMGPGKGSSIRTLLPDEAAKIAFMLATEADQSTLSSHVPNPYPGGITGPILDFNRVDVKFPRLCRRRGIYEVEHEFHLNLYFSRMIDNPNFSVNQILGVPTGRLGYWTTEFPWGYTADTADFVVSVEEDGEDSLKVLLFEFKKGAVDKSSLVEALLYVPWVTQILVQFKMAPQSIEVQPVLVGRRRALTSVPDDYTIKLHFFPTGSKLVSVRRPVVILYEPVNIFQVGGFTYASDLRFFPVSVPVRLGFRPPPPTITTTSVERKWVAQQYFQSF